jgi:hypothetical protein
MLRHQIPPSSCIPRRICCCDVFGYSCSFLLPFPPALAPPGSFPWWNRQIVALAFGLLDLPQQHSDPSRQSHLRNRECMCTFGCPDRTVHLKVWATESQMQWRIFIFVQTDSSKQPDTHQLFDAAQGKVTVEKQSFRLAPPGDKSITSPWPSSVIS